LLLILREYAVGWFAGATRTTERFLEKTDDRFAIHDIHIAESGS
jgi:hypothetical protein